MYRAALVLSVSLALVSASTVFAAPIVNGIVLGGEYTVVLNDTAPELTQDFYNSGLDIEALHFDSAAGWNYMGLTVVLPPVDTNGDPTSFLGISELIVQFYDATGATPLYMVEVTMAGAGAILDLYSWTGATWASVALAPGDFSLGVGAALELGIDATKMPSLGSTFYVRSQLDGVGNWNDDQVQGLVPEPATLGLLGLGFVAMLARRRRRS